MTDAAECPAPARPWYRRGMCVDLAALLVAWAAAAVRVLWSGRGLDDLTYATPAQDVTLAAWANGNLPLWSSGAFGGTPHLGNTQTAALYPLHLLAAPFSDLLGGDVMLIAHVLVFGCGLYLLGRTLGWTTFPENWRLGLQTPVDTAVLWLRDNLFEQQVGPFLLGTRPLSNFIIIRLLDPLDRLLQEQLSWPAIVLLVGLLGYWVSGWRLALGGTAVLFAVGLLGMWELAMVTLSQVIVAVFFSLLIAIPLGIWAARNDMVAAVLRPVLDFLQTIPAFVYLVPVVMLFNVGRVPGIMASVLYALPPAIRLTNLGIRQANPEAVEAAQAFGSTRRQLLFKVQLPLALPSIMAGINQTVMMVLAMVVVAGMVGGAGLGLEAVNGLARNQLGQGIEAGLAIVILAVVIDRLLLAGAARTSVNGNQ